MNILSKSSGLSLKLHSECVSKIAIETSKQMFSKNFLDENLEKIKHGALTHDIGKCAIKIQEYLNSFISEDEQYEVIENSEFLHHEISWAVCSCLFDERGYEHVLNAIYWHHAKPKLEKDNNSNEFISNILNSISDDELKTMYGFAKEIIPTLLISFDEFMENVVTYKTTSNKRTPNYYSPISDSQANKYAIIYRAVLISSDRIASQLSIQDVERVLIDDNFCLSLINCSKPIFNFKVADFYDKQRVSLQQNIAKQCDKNGTFIIKAPAGFGKTFVGLAWSLQRTRKLLWVCPRNVIVESVYDSILCELENSGLSGKVSVELFVTGSRKKCTHANKSVFQSDIVVTNIDNFLAPVAKNKFGVWSCEILKRDVVFDEFHEFITENALFSGFVEIMKIRHQIVACSTVMLSATPNDLNFLWDSPMKKTNILPNEDEHYPAAHQKKYTISFINEDDVVKENNSFIITNSIYNAQLKKKELGIDLLIHSDFLEEDKKHNMKILFDHYKKNSTLKEKPSVVSSPIMQASMDISSYILYQSSLSPEADIQRIGRCCRFGEYDNPLIKFFKAEKEKGSESKAIETLYSLQLNKIWINFLEEEVKHHNFQLTLDELYVIYNKFYKECKTAVREFISKKRMESLMALSKIEPVKFSAGQKTKGLGTSAASVSLRTGGDSIFVTYRIHGSENDYIDPFSMNVPKNINKEDYFQETDDDFLRNFTKVFGRLNNDDRFYYSKRLKNEKGLKLVRKVYDFSFRECSPYIAFNKEYSKEYGLAKLKIYFK